MLCFLRRNETEASKERELRAINDWENRIKRTPIILGIACMVFALLNFALSIMLLGRIGR
jgi:hypothetical protein